MKTNNMMKAACLMLMASATTSAFAQKMNIEHKGDTTIVKVENPTKYLLLPIQEEKDEAQVLLDTGSKDDTWMDVRLAQNGSDYYVPFALGKGKTATVKILGLKKDALALNLLKLSDTFDTTNTDYYRPSYHFTPLYGWMNDPNGMVYKDGEYHLYFQYNPYGSKWGNMHWGHAVSKDLVHWEHLDPAIARDPVGHIFSGSSVVDKKNTAGFGKNAIIAIYTNNSSVNHDEVQCIAYSNDNGRTFTKYEGNPVLTPFDGLKDFRDPKVFWYEKGKCWYMIVSADKETRFYKSKNLKKWTYVSAFGKGLGQQPCQYECPDFFQLPVNGDKKKMKWVMTMNINPGCWFGGSATEYFVGDFDGKKFTCPDANEVKWLDWGKDHYATVTFSNTGDRVLGITWMSNWQYANLTPFKQNRGANGLPRELKLYENNGKYYVSENVAPEVYALRKETKDLADASVADAQDLKGVAANMNGAFEIEADVTPDANGIAGIEISNNKRERTLIYFDMKQGKVVMDRTESGLTDFGKQAVPHDIELAWDKQRAAEGKEPARIANSINYKNDFALATWAPLSLCEDGKKTYHVDIFVDKSSVELFVDGGRIAMTNLVFPVAPYENVKLYTKNGKAEFKNLKVHKLGL